jgi:DNA polymerase-3 subunit epsilon
MFPSSDTATVQYLDMLDWVLDDLVIDDLERQDLVALAEELGLSGDMVQRAHANYFQSIVSAAQRDGLITAQENEVMSVVAKALDIDLRLVPRVTVKTVQRGALAAGVRVCFTGTAMVKNRHVDRAELESLAASAGLQPVSSVTKRGCDVLVAADPSSMSGKTQKARQWGISVVSVSDFWRFCSGQ